MRFLLLNLLSLGLLCGCQLIYKLPTRQGNVIDQKDLDKLQLGMTREQVRFVMGTPVATSPFRDNRWDYFGYYKSPRGDVSTRNVTLYFEGDKLARMEGVERPRKDEGPSSPDVDEVLQQERQDKAERERGAAQPGADTINTPDT